MHRLTSKPNIVRTRLVLADGRKPASRVAPSPKAHICRESHTCCCSLLADEPNEECPVHSSGPWPPRCGECGRFLPWTIRGAGSAGKTLNASRALHATRVALVGTACAALLLLLVACDRPLSHRDPADPPVYSERALKRAVLASAENGYLHGVLACQLAALGNTNAALHSLEATTNNLMKVLFPMP